MYSDNLHKRMQSSYATAIQFKVGDVFHIPDLK